MSDADTTKKARKNVTPGKRDWSRLDAMTEAQKREAATNDPDNPPLSHADMKRMKRSARAKIIRRALGLSQEEFAASFHIPIGTLRDWEQGRAEPDQAARAYLRVIARAPDVVRKALASSS
jgi:putative transcriptional regulator